MNSDMPKHKKVLEKGEIDPSDHKSCQNCIKIGEMS